MTDIMHSENQDEMRPYGSLKFVVFTILWLVAVTGLTIGMIEYSNSPGNPGEPPAQWPDVKQLALNQSKPTLVMFIHPHCPCTRASLGELEIIMAKCSGRFSAYVVLVKPEGTAADWAETGLKKSASQIPGVTLVVDDAGRLAQEFQCKTSGATLLFGQDSSLIFQGGITSSQGHSGDNAGRSAIVDILHGRIPEKIKTPVFGCGLVDSMCAMGDVN